MASKGEAEVYRPAEACRIAEVAPYVLRYWETEFTALSEGRDKSNNAKLYTARDVRIISRIRELLYDEGFTVAGAKKRLDAEIAEGRFDAGLAAAPPISAQKDANKGAAQKSLIRDAKAAPAPPVASKPQGVERPAAERPKRPAATTAAPVQAAPTPAPGSAASKPAEPGLDRKMVLRELKDIVRLLGR